MMAGRPVPVQSCWNGAGKDKLARLETPNHYSLTNYDQ